MKAHVSSIQVAGILEFVDSKGKEWKSAIAKKPVSGAVRTEATHVHGDQQADHGEIQFRLHYPIKEKSHVSTFSNQDSRP